MIFRGKPYYTLGLYPVLFASGALAFEYWFVKRIYFLRYLTIILIILTAIPFIPLSAPVLQKDKLAEYSEWTAGIIGPALITWEDGKVYDIPQDFADMTGWKQLAEIVYDAFNSLSDEEKNNCMIYAPNYGRAGAIRYYTEGRGIPEPVCFNDAFLFWAPDQCNEKVFIYVDNDTSSINNGFANISLYGKVEDPYFRENGTAVYICRDPNQKFNELYERVVSEAKSVYVRKSEIKGNNR